MHWNDIEEIVKVLEENYPDEEIDNLRFSYLEEMIRSLNEFEDHSVKVSKKILEEILETWLELKKER